jgi:O-acetyl-ADP-ribose deacetylase (regulator of RNase III)
VSGDPLVLSAGAAALAVSTRAAAVWAAAARPRRWLGRRSPADRPARAGRPAVRAAGSTDRSPRALDSSDVRLYRPAGIGGPHRRYVGIVTGDLRRVRCADVWVNSENTEMLMARFDEFSVSSIIRYGGARRDDVGRVVGDCIAAELERKVAGRRPVPAGTAIVTGPGELRRSNVGHVVHVAAVQGEPGVGFRQVREIGRCVTSVLAEVDSIEARPPPRTVLFPLLGVGHGGGELEPTISSLAGAVVDYFAATPGTRITAVYFLAYTDTELAACETFFAASKWVRVADTEVAQPENPPAEPAPPPRPAPPENPRSAAPAPAWKKLRMGFVIDVVGYGARPALSQETVQRRLPLLLERVLRECGASLDTVDHQWTGDGANVFFSDDIDLTTALPELIRSLTRYLAEQDRSGGDRIRLRMAVGVGIVGRSPVGFAGSVIVDMNRLVDSEPLRAAVDEHPGADLLLLLSDHVYSYIVRPGYAGLPSTEFRRVDVAMKEFNEPAWLWIPQLKSPDLPGGRAASARRG